VRDEHLTRVFGLFESVVSIGVAAGSAATPVLIGLLGLRPAMVATGLVLPTVALVAWRPLRRLDGDLAVRDGEIDVLRSSPVLRLLPVPSIEYLASRAAERRFPAGTAICEQGEPGDSFYVLSEGRAEALHDGSVLRTLGPGDGFGEIALLEDIPRTATVRAVADVVALELDRESFLDAVAGHRTTHEAANRVAAGHPRRAPPRRPPP
jgi:hypothetical protein